MLTKALPGLEQEAVDGIAAQGRWLQSVVVLFLVELEEQRLNEILIGAGLCPHGLCEFASAGITTIGYAHSGYDVAR